jgi:hypothetical protein
MPNKLFFSAILVILTFGFFACQDNSTSPEISEQDLVIQKSMSMSEGSTTLISVLPGNDDNGKYWEVRIDMPGDGGIVKYEFLAGAKILHQIKGLTPSFDYEITPGLGLVKYSTARRVALEAVDGEIREWKLERDESDVYTEQKNMWQYRFRIVSNGDKYEVRINAATGVVIRVKK